MKKTLAERAQMAAAAGGGVEAVKTAMELLLVDLARDLDKEAHGANQRDMTQAGLLRAVEAIKNVALGGQP